MIKVFYNVHDKVSYTCSYVLHCVWQEGGEEKGLMDDERVVSSKGEHSMV